MGINPFKMQLLDLSIWIENGFVGWLEDHDNLIMSTAVVSYPLLWLFQLAIIVDAILILVLAMIWEILGSGNWNRPA